MTVHTVKCRTILRVALTALTQIVILHDNLHNAVAVNVSHGGIVRSEG